MLQVGFDGRLGQVAASPDPDAPHLKSADDRFDL
jgi:hypothetical protein